MFKASLSAAEKYTGNAKDSDKRRVSRCLRASVPASLFGDRIVGCYASKTIGGTVVNIGHRVVAQRLMTSTLFHEQIMVSSTLSHEHHTAQCTHP